MKIAPIHDIKNIIASHHDTVVFICHSDEAQEQLLHKLMELEYTWSTRRALDNAEGLNTIRDSYNLPRGFRVLKSSRSVYFADEKHYVTKTAHPTIRVVL